MVKKADGRHILVIRLSAMGDAAMLVPILLELVSEHPSLRLTVLTKAHFAPIFQKVPRTTVAVADVKKRHKGVLGLFGLFRELRKLQIDQVADCHNVLRSKILGFFFRLTGVEVTQIDKGRAQKKALTQWRPKTIHPLKTTHQRYADIFRKLNVALDAVSPHFLAQIDPVESQKDTKHIGIAPFAAHKGKMYPLKMMEQVIAGLAADYRISLFGGGSKETEQLETLCSKFGPNVVNQAGKVGFGQELDLISGLDLMVSMDSGNGHLAANFGIPVITIWGVTHPYAGFAPYGQPEANALLADRDSFPLLPTSVYGNKWPDGYEKAIETVAPEEVLKRITEVLESGS